MGLLAVGTIVGCESKPWEMKGDDGVTRSGMSHTLTVSTGDGTEALKVKDDDWALLGNDADKLRQFGRPVVVRCKAAARDSDYGSARLNLTVVDIEFVKLADLARYGYTVDVYVEEPDDDTPPASKAPKSNGAALASV